MPSRTVIDLPSGTQVGRYIVRRKLASLYGTTYEARDVEHDLEVFLDLAHGSGEASQFLFCREARILTRLLHPTIVPILDAGTFGEHVWLATEHVRGRSLHDWLDSPHDWRDTLALMRQAGVALAVAHRFGFVHGSLGV